MRVYVMNYDTLASFEAEHEDPSFKDMTLDDFCSPQLVRLYLQFGDAELDNVKRTMLEDLSEIFEEDDFQASSIRWEVTEWEVPFPNARTSKIIRAVWTDDGAPAAVAVVHQMETE